MNECPPPHFLNSSYVPNKGAFENRFEFVGMSNLKAIIPWRMTSNAYLAVKFL